MRLHFADGETEVGDRPRSHRESMMELAFTACDHSSLSSEAGAGAAAEVRSSQPRGLGVNVWGLLTGLGTLLPPSPGRPRGTW